MKKKMIKKGPMPVSTNDMGKQEATSYAAPKDVQKGVQSQADAEMAPDQLAGMAQNSESDVAEQRMIKQRKRPLKKDPGVL